MELELTMMERFLVITWMNSFKGGMKELKALSKDAKQLVVMNEELEAVGGQVNPNGDWSWDLEAEKPRTFKVSKETIDFFKACLKKMDESKEFTIRERAAIDLDEKLNAK